MIVQRGTMWASEGTLSYMSSLNHLPILCPSPL